MLRGLHQDNAKRIGKSGVASHVASDGDDDVVLLILFIIGFINQMPLLKLVPIDVSHSATDDHSWQEEARWDVDAIGDGHQEVPREEEDKHVFSIDDDTAAHDVLDDLTFRTPENGC